MKIAEIKQALEELGVEYPKDAKKPLLVKMLEEVKLMQVNQTEDQPVEQTPSIVLPEKVMVQNVPEAKAVDSRTFTENGVKYQKFFDKDGNSIRVIRL